MGFQKVVINSVAFAFLLLAALLMYPIFWPASILLVFSAFDQLEDVYKEVKKKRLLPKWLKPFDIFMEIVLALFGVALAVFAFYYSHLFVHTYLLWGVAALGALIAISAVSDIAEWFTTPVQVQSIVARRTIEYKFVKKKGQ